LTVQQQQYIAELQEQNALLNSMAITECNLHVGAPGRSMYGMAKPQYYEYVRKARETKLGLREYAKDMQHMVSEDLLIRSNKEILKNILPFLKAIVPDCPVADTATFKRYGGPYNNGGSLAEEEARDNFFREQVIEEEYRQLRRKPRRPEGAALVFQAKSQYRKDDLLVQEGGLHEINDSDLDMLLEDLNDVLNEEEIEDC